MTSLLFRVSLSVGCSVGVSLGWSVGVSVSRVCISATVFLVSVGPWGEEICDIGREIFVLGLVGNCVTGGKGCIITWYVALYSVWVCTVSATAVYSDLSSCIVVCTQDMFLSALSIRNILHLDTLYFINILLVFCM